MAAAAREVDAEPGMIPADLLQQPEPLVLRGLVAHWPCANAGEQGAVAVLDYLQGLARDTDVLAFRGRADMDGRFFYNDDLSGFNFDRVTLPLHKLLDELRAPGERPLYLGSTSVEQCFPGFRASNDLELDDARPLVSIWMGGHSRISAHFDAPENIACVVAGRRRFTLFPPSQLANLYVGPLDLTPAGQAISLVDFAAPDLERFPRFQDALDAAVVAELEPGDGLYLPSMWWHHVESLAPLNVLVNYWWTPGAQGRGNPMNALVHALLTIRDLPEPQREAWRGLFEHYVFSGGAELSHIPENRRGILGEIDEGLARQLRAMLRSRLGGKS
jgi:hypothetical protein